MALFCNVISEVPQSNEARSFVGKRIYYFVSIKLTMRLYAILNIIPVFIFIWHNKYKSDRLRNW